MTIKKIIIIGPFNSGTNLIENLLINNCYHENKNLISVVKNNTIYWKHTLNMKLLETICDENTLIIIMYKEIYNWIASTQISKYWFNFNKINDKIQFNVDKNASVIEKKFHQNCSFNNIVEVYNSYYDAYKNLKNNNVIYVNYKKLISENSFNYLNDKLNKFNICICNKKMFENELNKPSKNHGSCVKNNIEAIRKYGETNLKIKNLINQCNLINYIDQDIINFYENC
jgi:hypothetical protein